MNLFPYIYIVLAIAAIALVCALLRRSSRERRHALRRKQAKRIYKKLNDGTFDAPRTITYLRKINPYTFEELVLLSFENKGYKAIRNKRYSGDGGIDGYVSKDGMLFPLQMKCYHGFVRMSDVKEFCETCSMISGRGFFVHTGKTGKGAKGCVHFYDGVTIISGNKLVDLIDSTKPVSFR